MLKVPLFSLWTLAAAMALALSQVRADERADAKFDNLTGRFLEGYLPLSPVRATQLGDHRFDDELDEITAEARQREGAFYREMLDLVRRLAPTRFSPGKHVDAKLLRHQLEAAQWQLEVLEEWAWNPLLYTNLAGNAIYTLLAREFAPLPERLAHVAARLERMPRFLEQVRATLVPARVPQVHAETAVAQNRGLLAILDEMVSPQVGNLPAAEKARLEQAMERARAAVAVHQAWLEHELLPNAKGDFRLGQELYERKLAFALDTPLSREEIRDRASREFERVRGEMYEVAQAVYRERYPYTEFPAEPTAAYKQAVIRAALDQAYAQLPARDQIVDTVRRQLEQASAFVRDKNLVTVPDDPVETIVMPEFQRGVAVAYCDSPGPLDVGQKTFYAVAPLPADWTGEQVQSFLREYNLLSLQDLTIHEAMPGHFLQLAHANRYPSTLRAVLASGSFIEGWAVYAERMMIDQGYLGGDPLMRLVNLKWYLRAVTNALIDQGVHVGGMNREEALKLMVEGAFQEEREAAGKWTRAQLTSAQLSTYFVGYQEHADLRREAEKAWGEGFDLKAYHDKLLSFGSPPVQYARALVLDQPIP